MPRFFVIVLALVVGYLAGAVGGWALVSVASPNLHDRELEAAMTGAFFTGPLGALLGLIAGIWRIARHGAARGQGGDGDPA